MLGNLFMKVRTHSTFAQWNRNGGRRQYFVLWKDTEVRLTQCTIARSEEFS